MNKLSIQKRAQILGCLVEGNSIRATSRLTGASKNTVTKLLVDVGRACSEYQDRVMRNLSCQRIQCDEIWAFCYAKEKNVPEDKKGQFGYGDVWTWTAICADTKLVPSFMVGNRDAESANAFIEDLASRLSHRVQLTTDGHKPYLEAVEGAFGCDVDYAMLVKIYGLDPEKEKRYSPEQCIKAEKVPITGNPDHSKISTSYVERQNLTMRMSMRRFTRLTNAFPKKIENLAHAVALHFMYYNFGRIHRTLRVTPAMEAGISDHVWTLEEIARLAD
ncbi:MAG: IS1 family transposase [Desulfomonilaceae bacterium]